MSANLLVLGLLLLMGCAAFLFGVVYLIGRLFLGIVRGCGNLLGIGGGPRSVTARRVNAHRICPRPECRKRDRRGGQYCSQCGTPLPPDSVDG